MITRDLLRVFWRETLTILCAMLVVATLMLIAALALSGCDPPTRYIAARSTWAAVEVADQVAARQYTAICPTAGGPYSPQQLAECRLRLERLERLIPLEGGRHLSLARLVRVSRDTAGAAVLALWAAEEGETPPDLRQRLSCVGAALSALARAFTQLEIELPVVLEQALGALVGFGGEQRIEMLGQCPGVDAPVARPDAGASSGQSPDASASGGVRSPAAAPSGATRDPFAADGGA